MSNKRLEAAAAYREKVKNGEIEPPKRQTPEEKAKANPKSLRLAIDAKCWECCNGQREEIRMCTIGDCALYPHRPYK